jgi:hypothetical protein
MFWMRGKGAPPPPPKPGGKGIFVKQARLCCKGKRQQQHEPQTAT